MIKKVKRFKVIILVSLKDENKESKEENKDIEMKANNYIEEKNYSNENKENIKSTFRETENLDVIREDNTKNEADSSLYQENIEVDLSPALNKI